DRFVRDQPARRHCTDTHQDHSSGTRRVLDQRRQEAIVMRIESGLAVAATFVVTASSALAQQPPPGPPRVQVGVFSTRLDGGTGGGSASIGPSPNESQFSGRLYLSACGSGMGTLLMT